MIDCIILCGGLGTRLQTTLPNLPKALAPVQGLPFLDLLLNQLKEFNLISTAILATGYRAQQIENYYQENVTPLPLKFSHEETPLGTGGAVFKALDKAFSSTVLVLNGDCYIDAPFDDFYLQHQQNSAKISLLCTRVEKPERYGQVIIDPSSNKILSFAEKGEVNKTGWISAGAYLFDKSLLLPFAKKAVFSLEHDVFPLLCQKGMYAYRHEGVFIDIGTTDSFHEAQEVLKNMIPNNYSTKGI